MRAAGYSYRAAGENIAAGRSLADPAAVVRAWLNSPGHCRVIMNGKYKELGVGRVEGPGKYGIYYTQNFGTRKRRLSHPTEQASRPLHVVGHLDDEVLDGVEPQRGPQAAR